MENFDNINLDNLVDANADDKRQGDNLASAVELPLATKSVWDSERNSMEQVPISYDADDFNFAMRTQKDGLDKSNFIGKVEVGDLSKEVEEFYAKPKDKKDDYLSSPKSVNPLFLPLTVKHILTDTAFGKGAIGFGQQALESFPKGKIRKSEKEIEDLKKGYLPDHDLSLYKDIISGDEDSLIADYVKEKGNINLYNRPQVKNADGTISTIRSMSFQDDDGQEVLIPTVSDDGKILSNEEAIKQYKTTGKHLGKFASPEDADRYAKRLHQHQELYYFSKLPKYEISEEEAKKKIATAEVTIKNNQELIGKIKNWFSEYELPADADNFDKFMYGLGNGGASVAYGIGIGAVTKNPTLASGIIAGSFAKLQLEDTYEKARNAGKDVYPSLRMGYSTATVSGTLEAFGFRWLEKAVKANTLFKGVAKGIMTETLQEGSQTAAVETMENYYGIDKKTWDEIVADALYDGIIGGITGGVTAGVGGLMSRSIGGSDEDQAISALETFGKMKPEERISVMTDVIKDRIREANPDLEEETVNNLAQSIAEKAEGSAVQATNAVNQVIAKESYIDTNDLTYDMWLKQVKQNLMKRGYTEEEIEEKAKELQEKNDLKTGFGNVYKAAREDIEKGLGDRLTDVEKDQAAELFAANAISMYKTYKSAGSPLEAYRQLRVKFEVGDKESAGNALYQRDNELQAKKYSKSYEKDYDKLKSGDSFIYSVDGKLCQGVLIGDKKEGTYEKVKILTPFGIKEISSTSFKNKFDKFKDKEEPSFDISEEEIEKELGKEEKSKEEKEKWRKEEEKWRKEEEEREKTRNPKDEAKKEIERQKKRLDDGDIEKIKYSQEEKENIRKYGIPFSHRIPKENLREAYYVSNKKYAEENIKDIKENLKEHIEAIEGIKGFVEEEAEKRGVSEKEWLSSYGLDYIPTLQEELDESFNQADFNDLDDAYSVLEKAYGKYIDDVEKELIKEFGKDIDITKKFSKQSDSTYFEIDLPNEERIKVRISDHKATGSGRKYGEDDFDITYGEDIKGAIKREKYYTTSDNNIYYQTAYAGSRTDYEKPSLEAIGSGEGAQAHGYGLYYALNKDVAEDYRKTFIGDSEVIEYKGKEYSKDENENEYLALEAMRDSETKEEALEYLKGTIRHLKRRILQVTDPETKTRLQETLKNTQEQLEFIKEADFKDIAKGQVHEVDIPEMPDLLDEQKTFKDQPENIQQLLLNMTKEYSKFDSFVRAVENNKIGEKIYSALSFDILLHSNNKIQDMNIAKKEASKLLSENGIKGITYDGMRDGRCFVIFDPKDVKVVQKFYQMAGMKAQTAALDKLEEAQELERSGRSNEEIRKATGWFKGADGKWRFEISDKDASIDMEEAKRISEVANLRSKRKDLLSEIEKYQEERRKNNDEYPEGYLSDLISKTYDKIEKIDSDIQYGYFAEGTSLGDLLKHEKLYEAYPFMRNAMVYVKELGKGVEAHYLSNGSRIEISPDIINNPEELKSTLMHEIQHFIQNVENFARGGSLQSAKQIKDILTEEDNKRFSETLEKKVREHLSDLNVKGLKPDEKIEIYQKYADSVNKFFSDNDEEAIEAEKEYKETLKKYGVDKEEFEDAMREMGMAGLWLEAENEVKGKSKIFGKEDYHVYRALMGEIEARNTERRINMSEEERRETSPESTQDVPSSDAIVVFSDGTMASYNMPQEKQGENLGRRGEIERRPDGYVIRLFEQADPSTLFHEMWHLFTFQLQEAAKTSDKAKSDWETLANWSGYNQAITPEEKREALERMARGGEQYLMKGKAPSNRLKMAFENFKRWLTDIYKTLTGLDVKINPDVERVFARLIGGKSLDYAFVSEQTELGQELKKMRQKNIEAVVSGRYIISDQTQMKEITGIERIKALTNAIIDLSKINKGKDLLLVMSEKYGDQTIEDIGNLIRTTHMRLPRRGDTLYTKIIKEGGISKKLDQRLDITGLMGVERNDRIVRKPMKREITVDDAGNEHIVWDTSKRPEPFDTEEDILEFLKKQELLTELRDDYTYEDLDAEWDKALNILESAPDLYLDNGARKIAEDAVAEANRLLEKIFNKPVSEIEEDYENFLTINRDFDIISKEMLADIRGLSVMIERETHKLHTLIKKNALEDARAVRDDIIQLLERSLPASKRSSFMKYISEIDTYERLISRLPRLVDRIVKLQEKLFKQKVHGRIENILKWSRSYKDSSGKRVSKFRDGDVQDFMDTANDLFKVKNEEKAGELIEKLLPSDDTSMPSREDVFKIKLLQVASGMGLEEGGAENYLDVYNVLLDVYKAGKFAGEAEKALRKEKNKKLAAKAFNTIAKTKVDQKKNMWKDVKQAFKTFGYTQQGWEDLMDILSSGDTKSKEYESDLSKSARVLKSEVEERGLMNRWGIDLSNFIGEALGTTDQRAILKYVNSLGEKIDLGEVATTRKTAWETEKTVRLEMSKDEIMDFYMKWQDPDSKKSIMSENGNGFNENIANMIMSNLTEEDIKVADALFEFYKSTRDQVFEAYRDEYGVSLGKVEFYTPRYREVNGDIESYYRGNVKAVSTGRVKERKENARGAIQFLGAFKTADRYITEVGHYLAWREKLRDLNTIFSDIDIRSAIRERFGDSMVKLIDKQIQDFATNGRTNANIADKIINGFRINFTVAALSIKPALTVKQLTSMFAFAEYVPTKEFMSDLTYAITHFKEIRAELDKSPLMKTRFENMQLEVNELANKKAIERFIKSPKLQEAMMLFVQLGDVGAIYTGGWSVYAHALRQGKSKAEALAIFEKAANSSQQSSYLSELSDWQRGSSFQKLFTMFTSSQNQYFRKEASAIRNMLAGRVDKKTALKRIAIYHFLLPMLFQWVCDLGRWDTKAQIRAALIGSLNGIFLIKDIFDIIVRSAQGEKVFDQTLPIFSTETDFGRSLGRLAKIWLNNPDFADILSSLADLGTATAEGLGLPLEQIRNLWEGAENIYEGKVVEGLEMLAGWTPYAVKNAQGGLPRDIVDALK